MKKIILLVLTLFLSYDISSQENRVSNVESKKATFGSQFYNWVEKKENGVKYKLLYLDDPAKIEIIITEDEKFVIQGKKYWDISYKDLSPSQKLGYSFIYGFVMAELEDNWFGFYGRWTPPHLIENKKSTFSGGEKPSFFVKTKLLKSEGAKLFLGQKVDSEQDITKSLIMVDSSQLSPKREKKINNINYTYATDSQNTVVFIYVNDKSFKIDETIWIGRRVEEIPQSYPIAKIPGWGFFVKINDCWMGLLDTKVRNPSAIYTKDDKIIAVFQSQRAMDFFK